MRCIHCDEDSGVTVLIESIPCKHCNGEIRTEYNVCKTCGMAWKTVDGELLSDTTFFDVGLEEIFSEDELFQEFDMVLNCDQREINSSYMKDYIHKCLKCQAVCHEAEKNRWECPDCGFAWEVIKTGD